MRVTGGIGEVVRGIIFVEPGGFEEAFGVVGGDDWGRSGGVEEGDGLRGGGEGDHVVVEAGDEGGEGGDGAGWFEGVVCFWVEGACYPVL